MSISSSSVIKKLRFSDSLPPAGACTPPQPVSSTSSSCGIVSMDGPQHHDGICDCKCDSPVYSSSGVNAKTGASLPIGTSSWFNGQLPLWVVNVLVDFLYGNEQLAGE